MPELFVFDGKLIPATGREIRDPLLHILDWRVSLPRVAGPPVFPDAGPLAAVVEGADRVTQVFEVEIAELLGSAVARVDDDDDRLCLDLRELLREPGAVDERLVDDLVTGGIESFGSRGGVEGCKKNIRALRGGAAGASDLHAAWHPVAGKHEDEGIERRALAFTHDPLDFRGDALLRRLGVEHYGDVRARIPTEVHKYLGEGLDVGVGVTQAIELGVLTDPNQQRAIGRAGRETPQQQEKGEKEATTHCSDPLIVPLRRRALAIQRLSELVGISKHPERAYPI